MTEQTLSTLPADSQPNNDSNDSNKNISIINEIAFTNQISIQWDELRILLKQRLDEVLKSGSLVYTAPSVTNPLTIKLAPKSSADTGQVDIQTLLTPAVATPFPSTPASQASSDQEPSNSQDQSQVPNQPSTESTLEESAQLQQQKNDEEQQKAESEAKSEETNTDSEAATKESTQNTENTENVEKDSKDQNTTSISDSTPANEIESVVQANTSEDELDNGSQMVPVSKDTLLVETPEGYHTRINVLLDTFPNAPFTIQRVCELLSYPTEHHTNMIKYLRAVEKVLMITSSINEFSNPAYNGISALDEDGNAPKTTANGDYSRSTNLNFMYLTEEKTRDESSDDDVQTNIAQNGDTERPEELAISADSLLASQNEEGTGEVSGMEVENPATDMDLDMNNGLSSMDGVESGKETESTSNGQSEGQNGPSDIQVDSEVDGGMELDQA